MWEYEHVAEAEVSAEAIWRLWADVPGWGSWHADIESISVDGPFAAGSTISMRPIGQDDVLLRLTEVVENTSFVDEATAEGLVVTTDHRLDELGAGRVRVTYRMQITGPAAQALGPEIGPQITADFPASVAGLISLAQA